MTCMSTGRVVTTQTRSMSTSLKFGLMLGIGGGVPDANNDIRLGDIVISKPNGTSRGVIQYDFWKNNTATTLRVNVVVELTARNITERCAQSAGKTHDGGGRTFNISFRVAVKVPLATEVSRYPGVEHDQFFASNYDHPPGFDTCIECDKGRVVPRSDRDDELPIAHCCLIASENQVMRDENSREKLRKELDVLYSRIEAAGLMDNLPCLVIRGVCDCADSHKNKEWQPYAAATAAAYAKELLCSMPGHRIAGMQTATVTFTNTGG